MRLYTRPPIKDFGGDRGREIVIPEIFNRESYPAKCEMGVTYTKYKNICQKGVIRV